MADIGKPVRDFWRPTRIHKIGLVTGVIFIGLGISTYLGDGSQTTSSDTSRCIPIPTDILNAIETGLTVSGNGSLRNGWAVHSNDFKNAYFFAAEIDGSGMSGDGEVGLWVGNNIREPRGVLSVNSFAKEFSDWGDGGSTDARFSTSDDGASEAEDCAGG